MEGNLLNRRLALLCLLGIMAVTAATFAPVLDNGFTSWDDNVYVTDNTLIRQVSAGNIGKVFTAFVSGNYHPLVFLSYSLEYRLFGLNPRPYHATNLVLHLLNTALVFWLLLLLSGSLPAAAAGTLLFALHPMRVEPVAWVTARKDLLGSAFFLGSLAVYLSYRRERGAAPYILSLLLFLFALLSKATGVTLPLVLLLCDFLLGRVDRRAVVEKVPFLALALLFGVVALFARESYQEVLMEQTYAFPAVVFIGAHKLVCHYLPRTVLPVPGLFPLYPPLGQGGSVPPAFLFLLAVIGILAAAVVYSLRRTRKVLFGALFFLTTLLPSLSVVVVGYSADRFAYLPSFGLAFLAGEGFRHLWSRRHVRSREVRTVLVLLVAIVGLAFALSSRRLCAVWRSSITLWSQAVESYPDTPASAMNRAYAHHYRGMAYLEEEDRVRALPDLNRAIELYPGKAEFFSGRGRLHGEDGNVDDSLADYGRALRIEPRSVTAYNGRGIVHTGTGAYGRAIADFNRALEVDPGNATVHLNLGIVLLYDRQFGKAAAHFTEVLRREPGSAAAFYGRSRALSEGGEYGRAWDDLLRSEKLGYPVDRAYRRGLQERLGISARPAGGR